MVEAADLMITCKGRGGERKGPGEDKDNTPVTSSCSRYMVVPYSVTRNKVITSKVVGNNVEPSF